MGDSSFGDYLQKRLPVPFHFHAKIIQSGRLTHAEIAKRAGTSRTRVTAIANGSTRGLSTDVLIRVLAAAGYRADVHVKKMAA